MADEKTDSKKKTHEEVEWQKRHDEAVARGEESYLDPKTGYLVFTVLTHLSRGHCCKTGCRHCPYGFRG